MPDNRILLGVIGRAHGVRGLVHVTGHTADPTDLTTYGPLTDSSGRGIVLRWRQEGVAEVALLVDGVPVKVTDRTQAEKLTNTQLFIDRAALPAPDDAEDFYLTDLIGLAAVDASGAELGRVAIVHDYGAGVSLEIERAGKPALIVPFTMACVPVVDVAAGRVSVVPPDEILVPDAPDGDDQSGTSDRSLSADDRDRLGQRDEAGLSEIAEGRGPSGGSKKTVALADTGSNGRATTRVGSAYARGATS